MTEYTGLFERAAERYQAPDLPVEGILRRRDRKQRNRRISAMVVAAILTVAALGGLIRAFDSADGSRPATNPPTPSEPPAQAAPTIIPPPPGVEPKMTIEQVEAYMRNQISHNEEELGKAIVPFRIVSIRYLEPHQRLQFGGSAISEPFWTWAVEYEGTVINCSSWCSVHPGGTEIFADPPGSGGSAGHYLDPVCFGPKRHPDAEPDDLDLPDCSKIPGSPVPTP